jgi:HEAT repeat protein
MAECPHCGALLHEVDRDEYVFKLIRALRHPEPTTAVRAATILGLLRERRAVQPLLALLASSDDPYLLESAVEALGEIGDPAALAGLIDALAHSYLRVRGKAAEALGKLRLERAPAALAHAVHDPNGYVRQLAGVALARLGRDEAVTKHPCQ